MTKKTCFGDYCYDDKVSKETCYDDFCFEDADDEDAPGKANSSMDLWLGLVALALLVTVGILL
ncbi:MAG TPA: hypothetical protein PKA10_04765 [Selenomonadales bacterium]|nr:hypothetical protein [Selenomonadales bacterium]